MTVMRAPVVPPVHRRDNRGMACLRKKQIARFKFLVSPNVLIQMGAKNEHNRRFDCWSTIKIE